MWIICVIILMFLVPEFGAGLFTIGFIFWMLAMYPTFTIVVLIAIVLCSFYMLFRAI